MVSARLWRTSAGRASSNSPADLEVEQLVEDREQPGDADAAAGGDVEHLALGLRSRARQAERLDHVGDVDEVAGLLAVAVDLRLLALQQRAR